jgi:hypothetical protein
MTVGGSSPPRLSPNPSPVRPSFHQRQTLLRDPGSLSIHHLSARRDQTFYHAGKQSSCVTRPVSYDISSKQANPLPTCLRMLTACLADVGWNGQNGGPVPLQACRTSSGSVSSSAASSKWATSASSSDTLLLGGPCATAHC